VIVKDQTVSLVWELSISSDVDKPLSCNFYVNYCLLNDSNASDVYECKHSFELSSCKASIPYSQLNSLPSMLFVHRLDFVCSTVISHSAIVLFINGLAVWYSGNALVSINEVNLCRAQLVLGWGGTLFRYVTSHPGQLSLLPSMGQ